MLDFCEVYGFHAQDPNLALPKRFPIANAFWKLIATGTYQPRSANVSSIRSPALRIAAKVFSNLVLAKKGTAKVRTDELQLLYYGVAHLLKGVDALPFPTRTTTNFGFIFAEVITKKKERGQSSKGHSKTERIGSLLTVLFRHLEVDLSSTTYVEQLAYIDTSYLIHGEILRDENTYRFCDRDKTPLFLKLPQPMITRLHTIDAMRFLPGREYLCPDPSASSSRTTTRKHGSTSHTSEPHLEDEEMHDIATEPPLRRTTYSSEFTLLPISDEADDAEY